MDNGAAELSHQDDGGPDAAVHDDSGGGGSEAAAALACNCCRRRKLRCSREVPTCQQCRKTGSDCVYESKRSKPGMKAGAIENLHRRLDALERTVHLQRAANPPDRRPSGSDGSQTRGSPHGGGEEMEKNAYGIMAFFAKELQRFNAKTSTGNGIPSQDVDDQPQRPKRRRLNDYSDDPVSPMTSSSSSSSSGGPALPDEQVLQSVLQAYFSHVHPWIPILHEARFRRRLAEPATRKSLRVVLHAMMLSAARYVEDEGSAAAAFGSTGGRTRVRDWIVAEAMRNFNVESLQALIIVAFNDIGSGQAAQAWPLVGSLTRTVEYLQLTVEHDDAERPSLSQPFVSLPPPADWTEAEERRRVFWNVFKLDRLISVTMGWNTSLTSDDVRRRLPCDGVLWRKEDRVNTPFFGIWDKAAGRIGNPIAFIPSHYAANAQGAEEEIQTPSDAGTSPDGVQGSVDMSTVGAFAYCIEATESLSRVTSYFLQQRLGTRSIAGSEQRDVVGDWLTRFKELDLRLVHWKMLLPRKWKADMARQSARMDPNLTLAHVTHNASMILLHQVIAFPPSQRGGAGGWPFRARLPSVLSVDTCRAAAVEISIIAENYLRHAPAGMPVSSQFAFCAYAAGRVLLLGWRCGEDVSEGAGGGGGELGAEFWALVRILDEMAARWAGPRGLETPGENLAGKYSRKLTEMHARCRDDAAFGIDVLGYTTEIDHTAGSGEVSSGFAAPEAGYPEQTRRSGNGLESRHGMAAGADSIVVAQQYASNNNPQPLIVPGIDMNVEGMAQGAAGVYQHRASVGSGELSSISQMLLDQQFVDMDRIISFDDGIFGTEYEGGGW